MFEVESQSVRIETSESFVLEALTVMDVGTRL